MKKVLAIAFLVILTGAFWFSPVSAQAEQIDLFQTVLQVNEDGSLTVAERIDYNFGELERHGIYRTIPYKYTRDASNYKLRIEVLSVADEAGQPYAYEMSRSFGKLEIKIGDANTLITGMHTYIIQYKVLRGLNYFDDHDELYWNTSGNEWEVPIISHEAEVILPEGAVNENAIAKCFTGAYASTEEACTIESTDRGFYYRASRGFAAYEGMTIVAGWDKGVVAKPSLMQNIFWFFQDNWGGVLPLITIAAMFALWWKRGKDEPGRGTIIPEYEAPDGLLPAELGTAVDTRADMKDLSATMIDLARRGFMKIKYIEEKQFIGKSIDYELVRLNPGKAPESKFEQDYLAAVFGTKDAVRTSALKNKFYKSLPELTKVLYAKMMEKKYFTHRSDSVKAAYISVGIAIATIGGFAAFSSGSAANGVGAIISGIIVMFFSRFMVKRTRDGSIVKERILGFKDFLKVTETDRLKFHNAPAKKPEQFEEFLAYAMVLGVEKEWAGQFKDIYTTAPDWYEGQPGMFNTLLFVSTLNSFESSTRSTMASRPSSAGSGGSGFSGGGSGGGFGGGGGGSW
ncbi:MAG: DUF2207 domain-containing protein [Patescibacteria group bacterium]|nr:DUF2207 domain-containing protein [Patescibacteria group bacterium]